MGAFSLPGKVALVTGGARGIGAAISRELAQAGASVAVNYRSNNEAANLLLNSLGPPSTIWAADISLESDAQALVEGVLAHYGSIDVLVLNAGVWHGGHLDPIPAQHWHLVVQTALDGAFYVARHTVPAMKSRGFGRIVVLSSAIGLIGFEGDTAYASAKAGLVGFVRALAKETGRYGITVNAVAPGLIDTDMSRAIGKVAREKLLSKCILRRPGTVDEVARAVKFLVCDGSYVTGQVLVVDGGMSV